MSHLLTFGLGFGGPHQSLLVEREIIKLMYDSALDFCSHIKALPIILDPEGIDNNTRKVQLNTLKVK